MITEEELRRSLLLNGHPQEMVDAFCKWYYGPHGWAWCLEQVEAAYEALRRLVAAGMEDMLDEMQDIEIIYPPKTAPRRPPRYAGPQNKGRAWNRQPPRLARSDCRKMRR